MKYAKVKFKGQYGLSNAYTYQTWIEDLEIGDAVIVESRDWYGVAIFEGYVSESDYSPLKYIVGVLDTDKITEKKETGKKIADLETQIENRVLEMEKEQRLEKLAKSDSSLKELIDELNSLK